MTVKKSTLALATALAACFVGCEWTGSSESDSWSGSYDDMNFSGTYRAVTSGTTQLLPSSSVTNSTTTTDTIKTEVESVGTWTSGANVVSGNTGSANVVPGSFSATVGNYVWNDNGSGTLVFTDPNSGAPSSETTEEATTQEIPVNGEKGLTTNSSQPFQTYSWDLGNKPVKKGSVSVVLSETVSFNDDGNGSLKPEGTSGSGTINYDAGTVTIKFSSPPAMNKTLTASYTYIKTSQPTTVDDVALTGSGTILYQSGAWTLQINPATEASGKDITIRYSHNLENSESENKSPEIKKTTGNKVTAITVSQNGQNLTMTLNNGIVMKGRFTNAQQTGQVNQESNSGYNTYNAQFEVGTTDSRMVGSLNYDLQTGYRLLNGTWTWGKNSYDVQAVGPAWVNSADASTLSSGVAIDNK